MLVVCFLLTRTIVDFMFANIQTWDPVLGRIYSCITEEKNEHDEYAAAVLNDDQIFGNIPLRLSKSMSTFLKLTGSHMEVELTEN